MADQSMIKLDPALAEYAARLLVGTNLSLNLILPATASNTASKRRSDTGQLNPVLAAVQQGWDSADLIDPQAEHGQGNKA